MTECWPSVRAKVMRATKLDQCGAPVAGPCSTITSDGFVSLEFESEIKEGNEIEVEKANGQLCVSDKACDEIKWINVTATFCSVDPDLFSLMSGYTTVLDFSGEAVGNRVGRTVLCDGGFALEGWSDIPGQVCTTTGQKKYGYFLLPWVKNAVLTGFTLENDAASFEFTGRTEIGGLWGVGPYNVDPIDAANTPGPLRTPIGPEDHMDFHETTIAPPAVVCGCQPLVLTP